MVKIGRFVAGKAIGLGAAVGVIGLLVVLAKKYNVGETIVQSFSSAGNVAGQAVFAPVAGLVTGATGQIGGLAVELSNIQENFDRFWKGQPFLTAAEKQLKAAGFGVNTDSTSSSTIKTVNPQLDKPLFEAKKEFVGGAQKSTKTPAIDVKKTLKDIITPKTTTKINPPSVVGPKITTTISTKAGGTRTISGSQALIDRLKRNLGR